MTTRFQERRINTTPPEVIIPGPDNFILAALVGASIDSFGAQGMATQQYYSYLKDGIGGLPAGIMAGIAWRPGAMPFLGHSRLVDTYFKLIRMGHTEIGASFGSARCAGAIGYLNQFTRMYDLSMSLVQDTTLAAVQAAVVPPNLDYAWSIKRATDLTNQITNYFNNPLARIILGARMVDNVFPPIQNLEYLAYYFMRELHIDQSSASLLAIMPILGEYPYGRVVSPGSQFDFINARIVNAYRNIRLGKSDVKVK